MKICNFTNISFGHIMKSYEKKTIQNASRGAKIKTTKIS